MYPLVYSTFLLASCFLSHARTIFISPNGVHSYLSTSSQSDVCMTSKCVIAAADVLRNLDETVDPCDNFYSFACGGWMKRHEVSDDQPYLNLLFSSQIDINRKLRGLLESKYESSDLPFVKMLKNFYNTCVDVETLEKQGSETLKQLLRHLGGWPVVEGSQWDESKFDWVDTLISFRKLGYDYEILFKLYSFNDPRNDTVNILWLQDPGMGKTEGSNLTLGLNDDKIAAYYRMMVKAAKLLGAEESTVEKELLEALRFEMTLMNITEYAKFLNTSGETHKTIYTVTELQKEMPEVPWLKVINGIILNDEVYENETIYIEKPDFLLQFADLITSTEKRVIANYMLWQAVLQSKGYLSEEWMNIDEAGIFFDHRWERGTKNVKKPRWKQCMNMLRVYMPIGIGSYYVRHYFSDENKEEAIIFVKYIQKEFFRMLEENDWMDEKTREVVEKKANALKLYIGYAEELLDDIFIMKWYENLTITTDSYLENVLYFYKWRSDQAFSFLKKSNEEMKEKYSTNKYTGLIDVNAWYSVRENSITIPAGQFHGFLYDKDRPQYMNFAAVGFIIGHEITHGFDETRGRDSDDDENEVIMDKETEEHLSKKVKCIIDQYDNYSTDIGWKVNGEHTVHENIADIGGLKGAYRAYRSWTKNHGTEPLLPGVNYTQNQVFWLTAAHVYCSKYQPEELKERILFDSHSPGKFRIIGPMSNLAEFSKDFNCPADALMNRKYKCEVW